MLPDTATFKSKLEIPSLILFILLTLATLIGVPLVLWHFGFRWVDWITFVIFYFISGLGITVGYHRLISHRSFECRKWVKATFLVAGAWALENSAFKWCSDHIRHHAKTDQESDPYNAKRGFWYSHLGWIFFSTPYRTEEYERPLKNDKLIMWQHRYYPFLFSAGLFIPFIIGFIAGGWVGGLSCFFIAGIFRIFFVLNSTFCINSVCHMWGKQPYGKKDSSRDNWFLSLITFGEGYHNYHHTFNHDYRNGPKWYNFDPSKWVIFSLSKLGLAYNLKRYSGNASRAG